MTWKVGDHVQTNAGWLPRQIVDAVIVAHRRDLLRRPRYRVQYGVYDPELHARWQKTSWRSPNRIWRESPW